MEGIQCESTTEPPPSQPTPQATAPTTTPVPPAGAAGVPKDDSEASASQKGGDGESQPVDHHRNPDVMKRLSSADLLAYMKFKEQQEQETKRAEIRAAEAVAAAKLQLAQNEAQRSSGRKIYEISFSEVAREDFGVTLTEDELKHAGSVALRLFHMKYRRAPKKVWNGQFMRRVYYNCHRAIHKRAIEAVLKKRDQ